MKSLEDKGNLENSVGSAIARALEENKIQQEKNMAKAAKRRATMLENAAEEALSGRNYSI